MLYGRSGELRGKLLDVRARRRFRFMGVYRRVMRAVLRLRAKCARLVGKRGPINLGMVTPSVSIFEVYPRTLESAFSIILVSGNSGRRRLRMPIIPGAFPNGSPVQCIRGVSKMYESQFDLMPLRSAVDEGRASIACPQRSKRRTSKRQEAQKLFGADSIWPVESHRGHLPIYGTQGIGRMRSANRALAASRAWGQRRCAGERCRAPTQQVRASQH
ncbi:hypothetical protein ABIG06_003606 [Bradyrhizobium sp. USDA 326]